MLIILNLVSPLLGLIGTALIFRFGIPYRIDSGGKTSIVCEQEDEEEKKKIAMYKKWGNIGLVCLMTSFFAQILVVILSNLFGQT